MLPKSSMGSGSHSDLTLWLYSTLDSCCICSVASLNAEFEPPTQQWWPRPWVSSWHMPCQIHAVLAKNSICFAKNGPNAGAQWLTEGKQTPCVIEPY